jgi:hypothetical protein
MTKMGRRSFMLKRTITVLTGIILAVSFFGKIEGVKAADATSGRGITIIPPSFELYANPGESVSDKIKVRNDSTAEVTYQVLVEDFKAVGEEGSVSLIDDSQPDTTYSLAKWVIPEPRTFTLAPNQEKEIPFTINVPKDGEPGGHYCSVLFQIGGGTATGGGASVASRVGSLILLRVSGNVKEDANVESFKANKSYFEKGPVTLDLRVKDNGNNHINPKGTIVITNVFGQKVAEVPLEGLNVLPGAIRKMSTTWAPKNSFLASRYTATLVATYGQQNKSLSASTSFIIFPKFLIYIVIAVLVVIAGLILGRKKVRKLLHNLTK